MSDVRQYLPIISSESEFPVDEVSCIVAELLAKITCMYSRMTWLLQASSLGL